MRLLYFITFYFLLFTFNISAQVCGTHVSHAQYEYTRDVVSNLNLTYNAGLTCVPIRIHIVRETNGTGGISLEDINKGIAYLNEYYYAAGLEFYITDATPDYIDNSTYYNFQTADEAAMAAAGNEVSDAINIYFVDGINFNPSSGSFIAGYAYLPFNNIKSTRIVMRNGSTADGSTLIHEMGHHYNLLHTFQGTENGNNHADAENVPRTGVNANCSSKGDLLCDTDADPGFTSSNINSSCVYTGGATDANGVAYTPPITNVMSYYPSQCQNPPVLTADQYTRIQQGKVIRDGHTAYTMNRAAATVADPSGLTAVISGSAINLSWTDNANNELGYFIERSTTSTTTGFRAFGGLATGANATSFVDNTVAANTTYYYRVKAVNDDCNSYSNVATVSTTYCAASGASGNCDEVLTNVTFGAINNSSTAANCTSNSYNDYTTLSTDLTIGSAEAISMSVSPSYTGDSISVWIDWNQDNDFDDNGEKVFTTNASSGSVVNSITAPATATAGNTRMRVRLFYQTGNTPCGTATYGEVEDYTINVISPPMNCGSETFDNASLTSSYADNSFVGDNGVTWTYVHSRDESTYGITGNGIMLRRLSSNSKVTSSAVAGGIADFTCSLRKGFTGSGNRQVELFVNGVSRGTSIAWDNTMVQTFTVSGINISGNVVVEIRNITSKQVIVDDISWTCYTATTPTITVASTSMSGFSYQMGNGPSMTQSNTLEWANLTGSVSSSNAVDNFEFSIDGGTTWGSATVLNVLIPPAPTSSTTPVAVLTRLKSSLAIGSYLDTVVLSSPGADTVSVFLSGNVIAPLPNIIINEFQDDPDATNGDANGDGTVNGAQDEFVEFYNNGSTAVNLTGYTIRDGASLRHTFPSGSIINAGEYATVFGGGTPTSISGSFAQTASSGGLGLNNSSDQITLMNSSGDTITSVSYTGGGNNMSFGRSPDLTGSFVNHNTIVVTGRLFSPGSANVTTPTSCAISNISAGTQTACVPATNEYTQQITITYTDAPGSGTLNVNGQSFSIGSSPQTVTLTGLTADGMAVNVIASFSADAACSMTENALFTAPASCTPAPASCSQLFISEYGEPNGGSNKYIEIYNPTSASIDLSNYQVWIISNGGSWPENQITLSGSLASDDVYVIANSAMTNSNVDLSNNTVTGFNGDDAIGLAYNGGSGSTFTLIDAIGEDGPDPGSGWAVAGISNGTANKILTRKSSVQNPNTNWSSSAGTSSVNSEWEIIDPYTGGMTLTTIGSHSSSCVAPITFDWVGTTSTDWATASNWSGNTAPTSTDAVSIPDVSSASGNFPILAAATTVGNVMVASGASLTVNTGIVLDGTLTNNGTVTLKDGAYLDDFTNASAAVVGNITVETVAANGVSNDQRLISSAVNNPAFSEIADDLMGPSGAGAQGTNGVAITVDNCATPTLTSTSNYGNLFEFNESLVATCALDGWVVRSSGNLQNGKGYSAYLPTGSTFDFTGAPNSGNVIVAVTKGTSAVTDGEGWNLIGNPYPSPISRDAVVSAGGANASYFVTTGVYQGSYSAYMPSSNIAIGQGFQVEVAASGNITFTDAMRNTNAATWYQNDNWFEHKLEVSVQGPSFADKTTLFFNNEASNGYEAMYDVSKRKSLAGHPSLSTFGAGKDLTLNGLSINDLGETIPMHLDAGTNGSFTLSFEGKETFPANTTIYLKDLQENVMHNIANGDYTFTANTADNADRFEIVFIPEVKFATTNVDCELNNGGLVLENMNHVSNRTFEVLENNTVIGSGNLANLNKVSLAAGNYTLEVTDQYGGLQNYALTIDALDKIEADFNISSVELEVGEVLSLESLVSNANTISWTINAELFNDIEQLTYSFDQEGIYTISFTAVNDDCEDTKSVQVKVVNKTTSVNTLDQQEIKIYPNPVNTILYIEYNEALKVELYNIVGEKVLTAGTDKLDLSKLTAGFYYVHVLNSDNKIIAIDKVVKE